MENAKGFLKNALMFLGIGEVGWEGMDDDDGWMSKNIGRW